MASAIEHSTTAMTLVELPAGCTARIEALHGDTLSKRRLMAMGLVKGREITLETRAPLGDPRIYNLMGYRLSIRNEDARQIVVTAV